MTQTQNSQALRLSFEYFPTTSEQATENLVQTVRQHAHFAPEFASVTFGAGGSKQSRTLGALKAIRPHTNIKLAGHLTTTGGTRDAVLQIAQDYRDIGIEHIVALRGDKPKDAESFAPHPEGFPSSLALISALKDRNFEVSVGAYPEQHPDSPSQAADLAFLKEKFERGADRAITQFFLEKDIFLRFRDRAAKAGIKGPLIPGILPIENFENVKNFAQICNASLPYWLHDAFANANTPEARHLLSVVLACEMIENLRSEGVSHFHIYTLNNQRLTDDICTALGVEKQGPDVKLVA